MCVGVDCVSEPVFWLQREIHDSGRTWVGFCVFVEVGGVDVGRAYITGGGGGGGGGVVVLWAKGYVRLGVDEWMEYYEQ